MRIDEVLQIEGRAAGLAHGWIVTDEITSLTWAHATEMLDKIKDGEEIK